MHKICNLFSMWNWNSSHFLIQHQLLKYSLNTSSLWPFVLVLPPALCVSLESVSFSPDSDIHRELHLAGCSQDYAFWCSFLLVSPNILFHCWHILLLLSFLYAHSLFHLSLLTPFEKGKVGIVISLNDKDSEKTSSPTQN